MGAEDLIRDLDALEMSKGPEKMTCQWWRSQTDEVRYSTASAVARVGHTAVTRLLRSKGHRVTAPDLKLHASGGCAKCPTS